MKTKILILLFLSSWINLNAQSLLVDGSEWHYTYTVFEQPDFEANHCYIEGDTLIQQKLCKKYFRTYTTCDFRPLQEFLYEEDDKLYYYEESKDTFKILLDYSVNIGDTIQLEFWEPYDDLYNDSTFYIKIDSISVVSYNSTNINKYHITFDLHDSSIIDFQTGHQGEYLEGIGGVDNFFYLTEWGSCDYAYNLELRCFNHPDYGLLQLVDIACDSVLIFTSNEEINGNGNELSVFPNPFNDVLLIQSEDNFKNGKISIYDILGKKVMERNIDMIESVPTKVNIENLTEAVYFITISDEEGKLRYSQKVLKK